MPNLTEGATIGPYRIARMLGEGGMGAVFEAVHTTIDRHVAIKVLHPEYAAHRESTARFFNEARAVNLIDHPGIVQVSDYGQQPDGTAYIVMELLKGESLNQRLRRLDGVLPLPDVLQIGWQLADVLAAAHDKGVIHRDLKPHNVMMVPDPHMPYGERSKLLDFGIAKLTDEKGAGQFKTRTHALMGTPTYMSPEQCSGAGRVDAKTDVYALGVMLFQMLAGRAPFVGEGHGDVIGMHLYYAPPLLRDLVPHVPQPVADLVQTLLAKDRNQRPSMRQLAQDLESLSQSFGDAKRSGGSARGPALGSLPTRAIPAVSAASTLGLAASQSGVRRARQSHRLLAVLGAFSLLGIGVGSFAALRSRRPPKVQAAALPAPAVQPRPPERVSPPPPRLVRMRIQSDPPGAEVQDQDHGLLGKTPFMHEHEPRPGTMQLTLRMPGYQPAVVEMETDTNGQIEKRLLPLARPIPRSNPQGTPTPRPPPKPEVLPHAEPAKPPPLPPPPAPARPSLRDVLEK